MGVHGNTKAIEYIINPSGCFVVTSHKPQKGGYIQIHRQRNNKIKVIRLHRYVYEKISGPIPEGMLVKHNCDNPTCINPKHLELGTHADNMKDKIERGRVPKGENHWKAKLTDKAVRAIRRDKHTPHKRLAYKYGVCCQHIGHVKAYRCWKHVA